MINIKLWISIFIAMEIVLITFCLYFGGVWFINTQTGFLSSLLIVIGSFLGYRKLIKTKATEDFSSDEFMEKIEDPYGVWDDDKSSKISSVKIAAKDIKATAHGFLSLYRVASYILFCILFLILVKSELFSFIPFIAGVSFIPLGVLICGVFSGINSLR
jgi:hypothetical protein